MSIRGFYSAPENKDLRKLYLGLFVLSLLVWAWAISEVGHRPTLLSTALLAYGFGLRHAMDADHIAAIDNVTRKLLREGKRPTLVGFFFALGHSAVVLIGVAGIALLTRANLDSSIFQETGMLGAGISSAFLLFIGIVNAFVLIDIYQSRRRRDSQIEGPKLDIGGGFFARLFAPLFKRIRSSILMLPLGFLFGLGFETATEIAILSGASVHASLGMSMSTMLVFPCLFAAGMMAADSANGTVMMGAYKWALIEPDRRYIYNLTITSVSAFVALFIGGIQMLGFVSETFALEGPVWLAIADIQENMASLGFYMVGAATLLWSMSLWRNRERNHKPNSWLA